MYTLKFQDPQIELFVKSLTEKNSKDISCDLKIEKEERSKFAVNGDDFSRIEIEKMKNPTGNQFVVLKLNELFSKTFCCYRNLPIAVPVHRGM